MKNSSPVLPQLSLSWDYYPPRRLSLSLPFGTSSPYLPAYFDAKLSYGYFRYSLVEKCALSYTAFSSLLGVRSFPAPVFSVYSCRSSVPFPDPRGQVDFWIENLKDLGKVIDSSAEDRYCLQWSLRPHRVTKHIVFLPQTVWIWIPKGINKDCKETRVSSGQILPSDDVAANVPKTLTSRAFGTQLNIKKYGPRSSFGRIRNQCLGYCDNVHFVPSWARWQSGCMRFSIFSWNLLFFSELVFTSLVFDMLVTNYFHARTLTDPINI